MVISLPPCSCISPIRLVAECTSSGSQSRGRGRAHTGSCGLSPSWAFIHRLNPCQIQFKSADEG